MSNIIVLDNDEDFRVVIAGLLTGIGHKVHPVYRASDAIDLGHLIQPELLITEWKLQDEYDGFEVCDAFRYANPGVKLIMTSDVKSVENEPGYEFLFRYFQKPIPTDEFLEAVEQALAE